MKKNITFLIILLFVSVGTYAQEYYSGESGSFSVSLSCDAYSEVSSEAYYISPSEGDIVEVTISAYSSIDGWDGIDATDWAEILGIVTLEGLSSGTWDGFCFGTYVGDTECTEVFTFENEDSIELFFYFETIWSMYDASCTYDVSYKVLD